MQIGKNLKEHLSFESMYLLAPVRIDDKLPNFVLKISNIY